MNLSGTNSVGQDIRQNKVCQTKLPLNYFHKSLKINEPLMPAVNLLESEGRKAIEYMRNSIRFETSPEEYDLG